MLPRHLFVLKVFKFLLGKLTVSIHVLVLKARVIFHQFALIEDFVNRNIIEVLVQ